VNIFVARGDEKSGPFTLHQARDLLEKEDLKPDDLACQEGGDEWVPLAELINPTPPVKSKKRKVIIAAGVVIGLFLLLSVLAVVWDTLDEAKRMERAVWHHRILNNEVRTYAAPPTIGPNGTVFVTSDKLRAYDGETGKVIWEMEGGSFGSAPALGSDGTLYFCSEDKKLVAADSKTGELKWDKNFRFTISSPTIAKDGTVYVGSQGMDLVALDGANGNDKWQRRFGTQLRQLPYLTQYSSPTIGKDGTIYIGSIDKNVYAINADDRTIKWEFQTKNIVTATPVIGKDGSVIVGSNDDHIYSINPETGEENWAFDTGGDVNWAAAIGQDGTVYVGQERKVFLPWMEQRVRKNGNTKWRRITGPEMIHPNGRHP